MKTAVLNPKTIERKWYVVDAEGQTLGRISSKLANVLMGKGKPAYSPNQDHGDYIIIINAEKVAVTGNKVEEKTYFRHSNYPGGGKTRTFKEQRALDATKILEHSIKGMLPKTALGRQIRSKLFVYSGTEHPHGAQKPEAFQI